ncbi:uncharacterized protein LOC144008092 isoform X2 [Festucalex cinctus]
MAARPSDDSGDVSYSHAIKGNFSHVHKHNAYCTHMLDLLITRGNNMRLLRDSASRLLRLLLLVELLRPSRCGPAHRKPAAFCDALKLAASQLDVIRKTAQRLRRDDDDDDDLLEAPLESLPILATSAAQLRTWKADESLRRLHANALAFGAHAHWLKASAEKVGVPSEAAGGAHVHLLRLVDLLRTALVQVSERRPRANDDGTPPSHFSSLFFFQMEALYLPPSPPSPSFPTVRTAFEAVRYSAETSRRLAVFCGFSKRILRRLRKAPTCPRRGR